ncbi:MAG TPA: ABC transporter permease [Dehalococcoidia bacterium]
MTATAISAPARGARMQQARHAWELLYLLTRRDLKLRYQDTALGFIWTAMKPLLFAMVIWFAMSKVVRFQVDMPYHLFLLSALLPWTLFQTSVMVSTPLIVNNGSLIKKIPFPVFVLPLAIIANNTIHFMLSLPVLVVFLLLAGYVPGPKWLVGLPFLLALQLALMMGLSLALSGLDVHFRDLEHLVEVMLNLLFYATPILYPISKAPGQWADILKLNPLAPLIESWRDLLVLNQLPGTDILISVALTAVIVAAGSVIFAKLRPTLADYL